MKLCQALNHDLNEEGEDNDIKELNVSNRDNEINNENENDEVYEPLDEMEQNLNINNNLALINRMQNNIPSVEAKRNEFIKKNME